MTLYNLNKILKSNEPSAIVRYNEWFKSDKTFTRKKYILLRIKDNDVKDTEIEDDQMHIVRGYLSRFKKVIEDKDGVVWERGNFQQVAKEAKNKQRQFAL
ncbi:hypothetical protein [Joostella sp.]|uniref:hypothetical protein n=1 Tax=Joostella sp. TaxID=2231138 RepID=UPI003A91F556